MIRSLWKSKPLLRLVSGTVLALALCALSACGDGDTSADRPTLESSVFSSRDEPTDVDDDPSETVDDFTDVAEVAKTHLEAEAVADLELVCELSSRESRLSLQEFYEVNDCAGVADKIKDEDDFAQSMDLLEDTDVEIEIGEVDEQDNSATVKYTEDIEYTGDDAEGFTEAFGEATTFTTEGIISMVKEDGEWKVDSDETVE